MCVCVGMIVWLSLVTSPGRTPLSPISIAWTGSCDPVTPKGIEQLKKRMENYNFPLTSFAVQFKDRQGDSMNLTFDYVLPTQVQTILVLRLRHLKMSDLFQHSTPLYLFASPSHHQPSSHPYGLSIFSSVSFSSFNIPTLTKIQINSSISSTTDPITFRVFQYSDLQIISYPKLYNSN